MHGPEPEKPAGALGLPCLGLFTRARICGFCQGRLRALAQRTTWPGAVQPSLHVPRPLGGPCLLLNLYLYLILTPEQMKPLSPRKLGPSCPETLQPGSHCPTVTTGRKLHEVETHQSQLHPNKKRLQDRRPYSKQGLARQTLPHSLYCSSMIC